MKFNEMETPWTEEKQDPSDHRKYMAHLEGDIAVVFFMKNGTLFVDAIGTGRVYKAIDLASAHEDVVARAAAYFGL